MSYEKNNQQAIHTKSASGVINEHTHAHAIHSIDWNGPKPYMNAFVCFFFLLFFSLSFVRCAFLTIRVMLFFISSFSFALRISVEFGAGFLSTDQAKKKNRHEIKSDQLAKFEFSWVSALIARGHNLSSVNKFDL